MVDGSDNRLDRYLAGELSPAEQRQLTQASLDDPELFDTLTAAALAKAAMLDAAHTPVRLDGHRVPARRRAYGWNPARLRANAWNRLTLAGTVAAAAAVLVLVLVDRSPWRTIPSSTVSLPPRSNPSIGAAETAAAGRVTTPPLFLTARLDQSSGGSRTEFRSLDKDGRPPRDSGVVVSVEDGEVTVDLGSIDGLEKGAEVEVFRGRDRLPVGRLAMTTIFRERSRGRVTSNAVAAGDRVELTPATRVSALLEQVEAHISAGDFNLARGFAERAAASSAESGVPSEISRRVLDRLGTLEHRTGSLDEAARHLRLAVDAFDTAPAATPVARARTLNELGAVLVDLGQHADAERILRLAEAQATGPDRARAANNLGALAALRGDRAAAESKYRAALILAGAAPELESDRRSIQNNLETVTAPR